MTTITLEVPDDLAAQFKLDATHWAEFVRKAVAAKLSEQSEPVTGSTPRSIYQEITDFLASCPTPEQIADFKISDQAQERLEELLDKIREGELTPAETAELDQYLQYSHTMVLLKASAHRVIDDRNRS